VLLEVARTGNDPFLQGDAISALRGMAVPRAVLEQAAAIAEADPNDFVKSRGEILRNYIRGLPAEDAAATARPVETAAAKAAVAYLDKLGVGVSTERCARPPATATPRSSRRCSTPASRPTPA
jgi:hypothetical protein